MTILQKLLSLWLWIVTKKEAILKWFLITLLIATAIYVGYRVVRRIEKPVKTPPTPTEENVIVEQGVAAGRAEVYEEIAEEYGVKAATAASVAKPRIVPIEPLKGDAGEKARILSRRFSGI